MRKATCDGLPFLCAKEDTKCSQFFSTHLLIMEVEFWDDRVYYESGCFTGFAVERSFCLGLYSRVEFVTNVAELSY